MRGMSGTIRSVLLAVISMSPAIASAFSSLSEHPDAQLRARATAALRSVSTAREQAAARATDEDRSEDGGHEVR